MNSWIENINESDLTKYLPELALVKNFRTEDELIDKIRDELATHFIHTEMPRTMYPTPDPHDFNILSSSWTKKTKNYKKKEVKELDKARKSYWQAIKNEIRTLLCTDDEKYTELRDKLRDYSEKTQGPVIATISATIAGFIGVAAGVISGLVAIALYAAIKIGVNAYCSLSNLNT